MSKKSEVRYVLAHMGCDGTLFCSCIIYPTEKLAQENAVLDLAFWTYIVPVTLRRDKAIKIENPQP